MTQTTTARPFCEAAAEDDHDRDAAGVCRECGDEGVADPSTAIVRMLERRERTAGMAYEETRKHVHAAAAAGRSDDLVQLRRVAQRASARWTEAQEALSEARRLAAQ